MKTDNGAATNTQFSVFMANKPGRRTTMTFNSKAKVMEPYYLMQLAVPMDSELAKAMQGQYPVKATKK